MTAAAVSLFTLGLLLINVLGARAGKQLLGPLEPTLYPVCRGHGVRSTNGLPGMASVLMPCVWPRRKGIKRSWMERVRRGLKASFCAQVAAANSHTDMQQPVELASTHAKRLGGKEFRAQLS